jgi:enoyl-CoA hydratase
MKDKETTDRRSVLKGAMLLASLLAPSAFATVSGADLGTFDDNSTAISTTLTEVPFDTGATLTIERRGAIALLGINRPANQNRVDPETFTALARAYYDYDNDPSLRAAILFGHGDNFSRGVDVDAFEAIARSGKPAMTAKNVIDPLAKTRHLTKPLIAVVHGDTWNMGHELHLVADIRIAAADVRFGQDENTHGRFPGGGSTVRFVREAGWGNAMKYILTGDHWGADEAYRMGVIQEVAPTRQAALERAIEIATRIAACAPLSIKTSLASAHLAIDSTEALSLSQLDAQRGVLYRTQDFREGRKAESENRSPIYHAQ